MKNVIIFSLNDSNPTNPGEIDLLSFGQFVGNIVPKFGQFIWRTSTIFLIKSQHLLMPFFI
jgi:hypothetical protein